MPILANKPKNALVLSDKPKNTNFFVKGISNKTYLETRTINKGQPVPWGLNWLITYPADITFIGPRV